MPGGRIYKIEGRASFDVFVWVDPVGNGLGSEVVLLCGIITDLTLPARFVSQQTQDFIQRLLDKCVVEEENCIEDANKLLIEIDATIEACFALRRC
jgi:hypothetical protein